MDFSLLLNELPNRLSKVTVSYYLLFMIVVYRLILLLLIAGRQLKMPPSGNLFAPDQQPTESLKKGVFMAKDETKRIARYILDADESAANALQKITGYAPVNAAYSVAALIQAVEDMRVARTLEDQAIAALATAQDNAIAREWAVHKLVLGVKEQVIAQFGKDSTQVQEIGLKRKSEYRTGRSRPARPANPTS
jgi:hypothetical protein